MLNFWKDKFLFLKKKLKILAIKFIEWEYQVLKYQCLFQHVITVSEFLASEF